MIGDLIKPSQRTNRQVMTDELRQEEKLYIAKLANEHLTVVQLFYRNLFSIDVVSWFEISLSSV